MSYQEIMDKKQMIMKNALRMDYDQFEHPGIGFDYEKMMASSGYTLEDVIQIQQENNIGRTPMIELKRLSAYARKICRKKDMVRVSF